MSAKHRHDHLYFTISKDEAMAIYAKGELAAKPAHEIVKWQLFCERLCVPFDVFHKALTDTLGRDVWTHELADRDQLVDEYLGLKDAPTMAEIIDQIPAHIPVMKVVID